jgi:hypothetical protein
MQQVECMQNAVFINPFAKYIIDDLSLCKETDGESIWN